MSAKMRILAFLAIVFGLVGVTRDGTDRIIQAQGGPQLAPFVVFPTAFGVSPDVRDLPPMIVKPEDIDPAQPLKERPLRTLRSARPDAEASVDPVVQSVFPDPEVATLVGPETTFEGLSNNDNFDSFAFQVNPPDTAGDVGPNHYVQQTNLLVRVWNKRGAPLTKPFRLSSLWANLGGQCAADDRGDPIVMYDPLADRWILSQFAFATNINDFAVPPYYECIAISTTPDPTGAYFLYAFITPGANFPDYPKLAVWPDAYYMTTNQFQGAEFKGGGVYAFDRARMLAGDSDATFVYFNLNLKDPRIGGMLPADMDGMRPPPAGAPNVFSYFTAGEFGDPAGDALRLFDFHVDFANPVNSTFIERPESPLAVADFNPLTPAGRADIEQKGTTARLDSIGDRLMHRLAYRNLGMHESLVVSHTVNVGEATTPARTTPLTHQAGVRYYELRRSDGAFTVHEQATFAPDTDNRWMGSAAMDHQGNLAVGYSVSSLKTFPSIRYAGRLARDPSGGLFQGEQTLVAGTGVQTNSGSRWGDYSAMSVDPADDCTFWYTNEYYTAASQASSDFGVGWLTRIGRFKFPTCTPAPLWALAGIVTDAATTGLPIPDAFVTTTTGFARVSDAAGAYSMTLPPDADRYTVTASAFGYMSATVNVDATESGTTIQNFALEPVPIVISAGAVLRKESCSLNGNLDPGERVTASFTLQNIGHGATRNLVAELQPTGGVMSPSRPQSYGVIPADGSGAEAFSFTANAPCGGTVVATLRLTDRAARQDDGDDDSEDDDSDDDDSDDDEDDSDSERGRGRRHDDDDSDAQSGSPVGDIDLGTVSFTFRVGTPSPIATPQTFSSGNLSTPIADFDVVEIPLNVLDAGPVEDINVRLRLNHTFVGDLTIWLIGPDGTTVVLTANNGGAGQNFGSGPGSGPPNCSGQPTVFDDAASTSITTSAAPFAGSFKPEESLAAFNEKDGQGTWRVRVFDGGFADTGVVGCLQLEISQHRHLCCTPGGTPMITAATTAVLRRESFVPPNNVIDPGERVTVDFGLRNLGSGNTRNLVATLQPTGGVSAPSPPRNYGELHVAGAARVRSFSFTPAGQCGATITPTLQLLDGRLNLGTVGYSMRLGATKSTTWPFDHLLAVTINDTPRVSGFAKATPYPANINVAGLDGTTISKVTATLHGFAHTFPSHVDVLLVGPGGQMVVLLSDAGGGTPTGGATLTFDDAAAPVSAAIVSGTYRPTNIGLVDTFPAPAPALVGTTTALSVFNGTSPNGVWSLFVVDNATIHSGQLAGGWSLAITVETPVCAPPPPPPPPSPPRGGGGKDDD